MDGDRGDNFESNKEETKINIISPSDNLATVTPPPFVEAENLIENSVTETVTREVKEKNPSNQLPKESKVVPSLTQQRIEPVTSQSQQEIEAVTQVVTDPVTTPVTPSREDRNLKINWQSYPYNSSDVNTLKNRANKVQERILSCSTNNDLIKLLANHKVSEPEIEWLVQNYLTSSERKQLENVYKSTQGSLFNQTSAEVEIIEYTLSEIIEAIDREMNRVGWSKEKGREYLMDNYGKRSRLHLSDSQLLEFWEYLKQEC